MTSDLEENDFGYVLSERPAYNILMAGYRLAQPTVDKSEWAMSGTPPRANCCPRFNDHVFVRTPTT